jgi:ribosome modulation factor
MAIIVEDGTQVAGANSLVSVEDYEQHAVKTGVTLTGFPNEQLIKAMQYINEQEPMLLGQRVTRDQGNAYPRTGLVIEGWSWLSTEIPRQAIQAQIALALDINAGYDLWNPPIRTERIVKRDRVEGAVEREYQVIGGESKMLSRYSNTQALMASLMKQNGLTLVRA